MGTKLFSIKPGVRCFGIRAELALALQIAANVYEAFDSDCVITSLIEGTHSKGSMHYAGVAADLRLPTSRAAEVVAALQSALGSDFDVVLEGDHVHVEFQPKAPY